MKKLTKLAAVIAAALLLFALLAGAIYGIFTDKVWVRHEYDRLGVEAETGWSSEYCAYVLGSMMDYSIGRLDTLENVKLPPAGDAGSAAFFNEREISHMADVRKLATTVLMLGLAALIVGFALYLIVFFAERTRGVVFFSKAFLIVLGVFLLFIIAMAVWMAIDFDSFWRAFHVVFLDLESSTFDPAESNMINICPAELFFDFIKRFALKAGLGLLIPVVTSILFICIKNKKDLPILDAVDGAFYSLALVGFIGRIVSGLGVFYWMGPIFMLAASILMLITMRRRAALDRAAAELLAEKNE